jgi:hypothetical protein
MSSRELEQIFISAAGLTRESEDAVNIGALTPPLVPAGLDAVMQSHTRAIDELLDKVPKGSMQELELRIRRGFRFDEYKELFSPKPHKNYGNYAAFRSLWITDEKRRRELIYNLSSDRYDDYVTLLSKALEPFHPQLSFFFKSRFSGSHFGEGSNESCTPTWPQWLWQIETFRDDFS